MIGIPPNWTGNILTTQYASGGVNPTSVMVAWPWVLEVGCVVCGGTQIMWPGMRQYSQYPEGLDYYPGGSDVCDRENWPILKTGTTEPQCKPINHGLFNNGTRYVDALSESQSILWTGDVDHPNVAPGCVPEAIIWNTAIMPEWEFPYSAVGSPDFLPCQSPFISGTSTAEGGGAGAPVSTNSTISELGGIFVRRNLGLTQGPHRFSQTAFINNVKFVAITAVRVFYPASDEMFYTSLPAGDDTSAINDWLNTGNKTLFLDFSPCVNGIVSVAIDSSNHNAFLSGIGSSLSIDFGSGVLCGNVLNEAQGIVNASILSPISDPPYVGEYVNARVSFQSTGLHPICPAGESFSGWETNDDSESWPQFPFGAVACGTISGGTVACNAVLTQKAELRNSGDLQDFIERTDVRGTWPVIAVDELGNGSRVIACGFFTLGGLVATGGRPAVAGTGLSNFGTILPRALALAGLDYEKLKT
jgi:hypothetical protein